MEIDVSRIAADNGAKQTFDDQLTLDKLSVYMIDYNFAEPFVCQGEIVNIDGKLYLSAHLTGNAMTRCARCLAATPVKIDLAINEVFSTGQILQEDTDIIYIDGFNIDFNEVAINAILTDSSVSVLCKSDCKGLCFACGADLNDGDCGCDRDKIDPRFANLDQLLH